MRIKAAKTEQEFHQKKGIKWVFKSGNLEVDKC